MKKFERGPAPGFLVDNCEAWGLDYEQRRTAEPGARFFWRQFEGQPVNQRLLPLLKVQTQDHCAFCDNFPVSPPSIETIEHFRPKSVFPREAYRWENLYFCCQHCQQKGDDYDEDLLRPDAIDYEFDRYFRWDFTSGEIKINDQASSADQRRAEVTIRLYKLNERHPVIRKLWLSRRARLEEESLDTMPYRHFIGP